MMTSILVVEDNPDDQFLLIRALKKQGIEQGFVVVSSGPEALDYLLGTGIYAGRDTLLRPQVILLDLNLPGMDGLELLRRIRTDERIAPIPVVILSSSDEEKDMIAGYRLRANSYIRKPVDLVEFTEVVRQIGQYWLGLNKTSLQ